MKIKLKKEEEEINTENLGLFFFASSWVVTVLAGYQLLAFSSIAMRHRSLNPSISVLLLVCSSIFTLISISNRSVNAEVITLNSEIFNDKVMYRGLYLSELKTFCDSDVDHVHDGFWLGFAVEYWFRLVCGKNNLGIIWERLTMRF